MDDDTMATFDRELIRIAQAGRGRLAPVAIGAGSDALVPVAAAYALGRAAEAAEPDLVAQMAAALVEQEAAVVHDDALMDAIANRTAACLGPIRRRHTRHRATARH